MKGSQTLWPKRCAIIWPQNIWSAWTGVNAGDATRAVFHSSFPLAHLKFSGIWGMGFHFDKPFLVTSQAFFWDMERGSLSLSKSFSSRVSMYLRRFLSISTPEGVLFFFNSSAVFIQTMSACSLAGIRLRSWRASWRETSAPMLSMGIALKGWSTRARPVSIQMVHKLIEHIPGKLNSPSANRKGFSLSRRALRTAIPRIWGETAGSFSHSVMRASIFSRWRPSHSEKINERQLAPMKS